MTIPVGDGVLSSTWLDSVLEVSRHWPYGSVRVVRTTRIGVGHGMSGRIHRIEVDTELSGKRSLVVKQESAAAAERELLFRQECAELIQGSIPACYGGAVDAASNRGVLLLEDVAPAEQGDVLRGCTEERARAALRALARLHGRSWKPRDDGFPKALPRWRARPIERERWSDRIARARERFPATLDASLAERLRDLPREVANALAELRSGPASWIQVDAHLDNVLWRPDGSAVLLDWCDAAIGPPAVDVARFLREGVSSNARNALLSSYVRELHRVGIDADQTDVTARVRLTVSVLVQGAVGWAGRGDLPLGGRAAEVCETSLQRACDWLVATDSRSHGGSEGV